MIKCAVAIRKILGLEWGYLPSMLAYMYYSKPVTVKELKDAFDISGKQGWSIYKNFEKVNRILPGAVIHLENTKLWTLSDEFKDKIKKGVAGMGGRGMRCVCVVIRVDSDSDDLYPSIDRVCATREAAERYIERELSEGVELIDGYDFYRFDIEEWEVEE